MTLGRQLAAEALGTALLLVAVVGSGIMAERLAGGNVALALLANAIATGGALVALIVTFGPVSGAHFNPVVTLALCWTGQAKGSQALPYILVQCAAAIAGVIAAHAMFDLPLLQMSLKARTGLSQVWSEFIATFGLLALVLSCVAGASRFTPFAVAAYITGAYWFTSSTSFANPAVTLARAFTDTFAGIGLDHVPGFMLGQLLALFACVPLMRWLLARRAP